MDYTKHLGEDQWERIKDSLPGKAGDVGRTDDNRRFIEAVMWISRTGTPWRSLPLVYGRWSGVHQRFRRWAKAGIWQMMFNTLAVDSDTEWLMDANRGSEKSSCPTPATVPIHFAQHVREFLFRPPTGYALQGLLNR